MVYLHNQGHDLEPLLESISTPKEFLDDPSLWLEAPKMEEFLTKVEELFTEGNKSVVAAIGHACPTLRSWGVLDSVLRMMKEPSDMYSQPQRFLSYFISPAPPIGDLIRKGNSISFAIPMSFDQYPFTFLYLRSALESLPAYVESTPATVRWSGTRIEIEWSKDQGQLFPEEQMERHISPDFMHSLEMVIEKTQKELEKKNHEILLKDREIRELKEKTEIEKPEESICVNPEVTDQIIPSLVRLRGQILRLSDYLVRSQQIVTLLLNQNKGQHNMKRVLDRLDWDVIAREFPKNIQASTQEIQYVRDIVEKMASQNAANRFEEEREAVGLNDLIESALGKIEEQIPENVKIETQLGFNQKVSAYPKVLESALTQLINCSVSSIKGNGQIRITTRPVGDHAKLEISEIAGAELVHSPQMGFRLREAKAIVRRHNGRFRIFSKPGQGAVFSIDLPVT